MSAFTGGKVLKCNFVRREGLSPDKIIFRSCFELFEMFFEVKKLQTNNSKQLLIHNHCLSRNDLAAVSALAGPSSRSFSEEKDFRISAN